MWLITNNNSAYYLIAMLPLPLWIYSSALRFLLKTNALKLPFFLAHLSAAFAWLRKSSTGEDDRRVTNTFTNAQWWMVWIGGYSKHTADEYCNVSSDLSDACSWNLDEMKHTGTALPFASAITFTLNVAYWQSWSGSSHTVSSSMTAETILLMASSKTLSTSSTVYSTEKSNVIVSSSIKGEKGTS